MNGLEREIALQLTRRSLLGRAATGIGTLALSALMDPALLEGRAQAAPPVRKPGRGVVIPLHFPPKAKRVIQLYMAGGPSHLETYDYKPTLAKMHGQPMPESFTKGQQIAQLQGAKLNCFGPQHEFVRCGKSGLMISSIFPNLAKVADDMCLIRSMHTDAINHDPAHTFMNTGSPIPGRPAMGSWLWYGLGTDSDDLPGFVVLTSLGKYGQAQPIAARQWHSGFLPGQYQGVEFHSKGDPVLYAARPGGVSLEQQKEVVDAAGSLNRLRNDSTEDPEIAARISQYELAFKMQVSVPELVDFSKEPKPILDLYGASKMDGTFGANCLLARRLAERGVRFIQLYHRDWDHHGSIKEFVRRTAAEVDQGAAALLADLKQRGMLDETLVIYNGEFGRTPMAQGDGRDHHIKGFSMWMAGGGIKGGLSYGNTDELGYAAVENPVHVHDFHATVLRLFGIDHTRLSVRFQGRDMRLTDIAGNVVKDILA